MPPGYPAGPPGYPPVQMYAPPPRRSVGFWLLTVGLPVAGIVLVVGVSIAIALYQDEKPATAAEQQLVLRIADLEPYLPQPEAAWYETAIRRNYLDRSFDIEYTFESDSYYVFSVYHQEIDSADARLLHRASVRGSRMSARDGEMSLQSADELLAWGDESASFFLERDGARVGHSFTARKGNKVVDIWLVGICIEDAESFRSALQPVLRRVETR